MNAEWEVDKIIDHRIIGNDWRYCVVWKPTIHINKTEFFGWKKDINYIEKIRLGNNKRVGFKVFWKNSWLCQDELANCDILLGVYLLLQTKKTAFNIIEQKCV